MEVIFMKQIIRFCLVLNIAIFSLTGITFAAEKVFFYHTDPSGSPLAMTDQNGIVVWGADYKPFGEEQTITGTIENNEKFIGKEKDKETGLYYFGARYMDPKIGRFVSPDPVGTVDPWNSKTNHEMLVNPQKLNLYAYALNNPYRYIDPDGRYERDVHYNLTYYLAKKAGFDINKSRQIATANQGVDESSITGPSAGREARRDYHFATPERLNQMLQAAYSTGDLNLFGQFLHTFQDSYSHAGYGSTTGHLMAGTTPDKTYNDAEKANTMAEATYKHIINFLQHIGITATNDWATVRDQVDQFNRARTVAEKEKILSR
jgi:RHS repeat-associated protein